MDILPIELIDKIVIITNDITVVFTLKMFISDYALNHVITKNDKLRYARYLKNNLEYILFCKNVLVSFGIFTNSLLPSFTCSLDKPYKQNQRKMSKSH